MLIEIHMIQNHSPANLNRDDLGAPKTCVFGGVTRARISSQCLKRSIRRSPEFQQAMESDGGVRTRTLITVLAEKVHGSLPAPDDLIDLIAKAFEKGGVKKASTKDDPNATNILMFLPESTITTMAEAVKTEWAKAAKKRKPDTLAGTLSECLGAKAAVPDVALCGRMTELDSDGLFRGIDFHVEAALSAAHAISTHEAINEVDYFTAADDVPKGAGAAHVNEAQFASACFYKYFCLDWDQLVSNLTPNHEDEKGEEEAKKLAAATLGHFLTAAATTTPTGKQNSFAAHNMPDGILVEIKKEKKVPTSYANAFAEPARRIGEAPDDAADEVSLVGRSIAQLGDYVFNLRRANGVDSTLLWYTPQLWRYPLRGWEREEDGKKKEAKPLVEKEKCFANLDGLVDATLKSVGFKWAEVKDAGKATPKGV